MPHTKFWNTGSCEPRAEKPGPGNGYMAPRPVRVSVAVLAMGEAKVRGAGGRAHQGEGREHLSWAGTPFACAEL